MHHIFNSLACLTNHLSYIEKCGLEKREKMAAKKLDET